jgi:glyoxylase-like metal-dependent hydrolase (beta-lactamase superfamily II)
MKTGLVSFRIAVLASALGLLLGCSEDGPTRAITNVTGDLFTVQNNAHNTVFLVTSEGIILTDPIGTDFAVWLKAELADRYDVPVKYVLYSHYHDDHASGGDVFADTATFVGHENMPINLAAEAGNEIFAAVRAPDITYTDRMTVELGGKTVEMIHALPSHSDDSSIIRFPDERTIFVVDFVNVRRVPFENLGGGPVAPWITANNHLQATVDYDIVAPGHGPVGSKADVDHSTGYLVDLLAAVTEGIAAGQTLEEMQQSIMMEDYSDYIQYDAWREQNIQGTYQGLVGAQ